MDAGRTTRLEAIERLFARARSAEGYAETVEALSDAIAGHTVAVALELTSAAGPGDGWERFFRTELWRVFEDIDGQRAAGSITDLDECYRIFTIAERLRDAAMNGEASVEAFRAEVDRLLAASSATPARRPLPEEGGSTAAMAEILAGAPSRFMIVDRVTRAIDGWEEHLATMRPGERADLIGAMALTRKEHARATRTIDAASDAGLLTPAEHATARTTLGSYERDGDGWPPATTDGARVAVGELVAMLHDKLAGAAERQRSIGTPTSEPHSVQEPS